MIANSAKTNFDIILKVVFFLLLNRGEIKNLVLATPGELCFCFVWCCCVVVVYACFFLAFFLEIFFYYLINKK